MTERVEGISSQILDRAHSLLNAWGLTHWEVNGHHDPTNCVHCKVHPLLATTLAQAEREREEYKRLWGILAEQNKRLNSKVSEWQAEVERLKGMCNEFGDALALLPTTPRQTAERLNLAERTIVDMRDERLRADIAHQHALNDYCTRAEQAEAALARTRAALNFKRDSDAASDDRIWERGYNAAIAHVRAALEGR